MNTATNQPSTEATNDQPTEAMQPKKLRFTTAEKDNLFLWLSQYKEHAKCAAALTPIFKALLDNKPLPQWAQCFNQYHFHALLQSAQSNKDNSKLHKAVSSGTYGTVKAILQAELAGRVISEKQFAAIPQLLKIQAFNQIESRLSAAYSRYELSLQPTLSVADSDVTDKPLNTGYQSPTEQQAAKAAAEAEAAEAAAAAYTAMLKALHTLNDSDLINLIKSAQAISLARQNKATAAAAKTTTKPKATPKAA